MIGRRAPLAAALAAAILLGNSTGAFACSFSWKEGFSPEEIKQREDVRKVTGTIEIGELQGSADENGELWEGTIFSRITTLRGTGWETWQNFHRVSLDCGAYRKPLANGRGIFWISRQKIDGRYEILLWEGEYSRNSQSKSSQ
ncbi:hypothetical protein [Pontixanthobacter aquaemixtae]|uniref:Uncharacterized protein n=1 Tax=Pontixanthobacter aquaemixtae TaxID=1958940 RepID=A0A844ZSG0_9SPHN|nr:hypothetical protein [Pontixanthobacter aquaemixtae]MXO90050.1 hypothetical protein [Pontixanthobacter aquaemixtae]